MNREELIKQFEAAVIRQDLPENFELRAIFVEMFIRNGDIEKAFDLVLLGSDKEYNDTFMEAMEAMEAKANMQHDVKKDGFYA